jgi:hypothetical protein
MNYETLCKPFVSVNYCRVVSLFDPKKFDVFVSYVNMYVELRTLALRNKRPTRQPWSVTPRRLRPSKHTRPVN